MNQFRKQLLPVITFVKIDVKRLFRDKVAMFFVFVFPLIFLIIFGSIFSGGDDGVSFSVGIANQSDTEFSKSFAQSLTESDVFEVDEEVISVESAEEKLTRSQLNALIILPPDFGEEQSGQAIPSGEVIIRYDEASQSTGQAIKAVLDSMLDEVNAQFVPTEVPFTASTESTAIQGLTQFDYTFSGIMGFTLLSLAVFGPTSVFPRLKQRGVLRRYKTTGIKVWQYFVGNVLSNGLTGVLAAGLMFVVGVLVFGLDMRGDYISLVSLVVLSTFMLFGIGMAIGGWAKNENQAAPLAQLVALPMMFLSGVFFPTFLMPDLLQSITRYIPLTPVVESIRLIVTEGRGFFELGPQLAIIAAWTVIIYLIAFTLFDWE